MRRFTVLLLVVVMAAMAVPAVAAASKLIVRNATHITLKVNAKNRAVVSFRAKGIVRHVLVWGAINAKPPDRAHPDSQVKFHVDYSGGSASPWGAGYWRRPSTPKYFPNRSTASSIAAFSAAFRLR
jgi:hypothetical protein